MIHLDIEAGGEYLLGFAKRRLIELKQLRAELGVELLQKWFVFASGEKVHVFTHLNNDKIKIISGLRYVFYADINPQFFFDEVIHINVPGHFLATYTGYLIWPDGSMYEIPSAVGTVEGVGSPNVVTYTNYPQGTAPILQLVNGVAQIGSDTRVSTYIDERDLIVEKTQQKIQSDPANFLLSSLFHDGHPMVDGVIVLNDKEFMSLVELDYTYIPDIFTDASPPVGNYTTSPGVQRTDGAYYTTTAGVTNVTVARVTKYVYDKPADRWNLRSMKTVTGKSYPTTSYFGAFVFGSANPVTNQGATHRELQRTYGIQMNTLNPLNPATPPLTSNKLLRAAQLEVI